ncbi:uncharacterized protein BXZ73DRAFT_54998 [Epithele typhae]|uniref:uncharacterized protein n=1 Tax=Epithele typhae TaxID=378194 RepID=UPI0020077C78|nr:uncharacterized protein BXZ73DRAFT_54998 [Epithele typhae]KAH9914363.1 hypothetical protein BXZ73DRAFT_54998 [Epithele typhae]
MSLALFQNCFYIGNNFNAILYGVVLVLYYFTISAVLDEKRKKSKTDKFFLAYSTVLLCCNTIFVATEAVFGEEMWVVNADYPGGMDAYLGDFASVWYQTLGTAATLFQNYLSDALLLYRCYVIWRDFRVLIVPSMLYIGSIVAGIANLAESARPGAFYFSGLAQQFGTAYTSCIVALNILLSLLICGRILFSMRRLGVTLGDDMMQQYAGAAAIVVESAALYTVFGIAYLISFAIESDTSILFLSLHVMFCCISPLLIVLRVMSGRAWSKERASEFTSVIVFSGETGASASTQIGMGSHPKHSDLSLRKSDSSV